ncbi:MAG: hypothetical protein CLLPBCKN_005133 [Chroococcidiopsis cubana SAG 39.79]|uniref:Alkaline phosphatase n=1 Tax=Chroococcidiopsis cubana SAG 39.79 TaxID=388085 RepID=A0AB37U7N7_9CYAN|nr:alkaline phosphatase [Chroococcidiopsis cubana]MDZ4875713.1 hypothetical protein [Chroococcidiopsis cubana SAG 39.79]PSB57408.1 alkaline phosphatase [Chroococcidiopsis cubana CCALA 043]RUS94978.1 alkaline phosphatase [Chroococcidiopsis cubana SAG 39.79]
MTLRKPFAIGLVATTAIATLTIIARTFSQTNQSTSLDTGNVIFLHPDGTSAAHWGAARFLNYGSDGRLNWDRMSHLGVYLGHMKNQLTATSNAGAVTHATGVKVDADSYGLDETGKPMTALSGKPQTIMQEAIAQGIPTAIINSGIISEPGTGAFLAKVKNRQAHAEITKQIVESGVDIILGGGEIWYLPKEKTGRHAKSGKREDGVNLIDLAKRKGYAVVYNREELLKLPTNTKKVLGIFAAEDTYNDEPEEDLKKQKLPLYVESAPTAAEMLQTTLRVLSNRSKPFFIVQEEEGTDNFSNYNNAKGCLEAMKRADDAVGVAMKFIEQNPNTMLLTAADSDASGLEVIGEQISNMPLNQPLPPRQKNGAPLDGRDGTGTLPFVSAPDARGQRFPFAIAWTGFADNAGSIVAKAHGMNAARMQPTIDNTEIYRLMYRSLFTKTLPSSSP